MFKAKNTLFSLMVITYGLLRFEGQFTVKELTVAVTLLVILFIKLVGYSLKEVD